MQEHKYQAREKPVREIEREEKQRSDRKERGWHGIDRLKRYYWKTYNG